MALDTELPVGDYFGSSYVFNHFFTPFLPTHVYVLSSQGAIAKSEEQSGPKEDPWVTDEDFDFCWAYDPREWVITASSDDM